MVQNPHVIPKVQSHLNVSAGQAYQTNLLNRSQQPYAYGNLNMNTAPYKQQNFMNDGIESPSMNRVLAGPVPNENQGKLITNINQNLINGSQSASELPNIGGAKQYYSVPTN